MLAGPCLQADLFSIILRWRFHKYVLTADITKMYRQILVDQRDTSFQTILWRDSPSMSISEYRLQTVTYGTSSAPFLALRVLKQLSLDEGESFPRARDVLQYNTYVDDCIFGAPSITEALEIRDQLVQLLARGMFPLAKWSSNHPDLLSGVQSSEVKNGNKDFITSESVNILGIKWNPQTDTFQYSVQPSAQHPVTKRSILSVIARLFDPLGWLSPVIITSKILMQRLWTLQCSWDDTLPTDITQEWVEFQSQLSLLHDVSIPRWVGMSPSVIDAQLHGFCDASSRAYAAAVYLRISTAASVRVSLIMAKTKVAPLQTLTIPRLELCAAELLARVLHSVILSLRNDQLPYFCWSDSTVTLHWVQQSPSRWKPFVAHRVSKIQKLLPKADWRYINTNDNPVDCASRGLSPSDFVAKVDWWTGPLWLSQPMNLWPSTPFDQPPLPLQELRSAKTLHTHVSETWDLANKFSSWSKLLRITAYIYQFIYKTRPHLPQSDGPGLTLRGLAHARVFWLRFIQREVFSSELDDIEHNNIKRSSSIAHLSPYLDVDGLLRVRGRLAKSQLQLSEKHPILLKSHPLVRQIVLETHTQLLHCGPSLLLSALRKEFWILRSRQLIRSVCFACVICTRYRARPLQQLMGNLPAYRVTPSPRAFIHVGVDYAGPIHIRLSPGRGFKSSKAYIAVFICMVTKAVHLEAASDYTTAAFHAALHRFVSRRGRPSDIYSDNGTNFVGEQKELANVIRSLSTDTDFRNSYTDKGVSWHFIPPAAPHFGGLWEVAVRGVKQYFKKIVGIHTLTYEEMSTLLCRIEACMNSRPLIALSDSLDDYYALTPGHFLIGGPLIALPEQSVLDVKEQRLTRWQLLQQLTEKFWDLWRREYIHTLQQRAKWLHPDRSIYPGQLVLVMSSGQPPGRWQLGRITECHPGDDGLVRVVTVKTSTSIYKRPITKLCVLPAHINRAPDTNPTPEPSD